VAELYPLQIKCFKATTTGTLRSISNGAIPDFENVLFNIGGGYDNTNYKFTAPVAGKYYFVVRFIPQVIINSHLIYS